MENKNQTAALERSSGEDKLSSPQQSSAICEAGLNEVVKQRSPCGEKCKEIGYSS